MATHSSILAWKIPDRGAWWAIVHKATESDMTEQTHNTYVYNGDYIYIHY